MKKQNRPRMPNWFSRDDAHFFRQHFTEEEFKEFKKQKKGLLREAIDAGIPHEDIKHYWYKSKKYSIFAKTKDVEQVGLKLIKFCAKWDLQRIAEYPQSYAEPLNGKYKKEEVMA